MTTAESKDWTRVAWEDQMVVEPPASAEPIRPDDGERPSVIVRPVVNALRIMRLLASADKPKTAAQIAALLNINRSTCFNILKTLSDERAIDFDRASKTYHMEVGHKSWQASIISEQQRLAVARRLMRDLSAEYSVTLSLWKRLGEDRISLLAVEHSPSALRIHMAEGQRLPILMGSSGRVVAPYLGLTKSALNAGFRALRWQRPIAFKQYLDDIEFAKQHGYSIDEGYFARGVTSIGVAVLDQDEQPRFTATAVMFQRQYDESDIERIGRAMHALSHELARVLI
jgi:DNA-binding IclR family transcriptional regulator